MGGTGKWMLRLMDPLGVMPYTPGKTLWNKDKPWSPTAKATDPLSGLDQNSPQIASAAAEDTMSIGQRLYGASQTPPGVLSSASTARSSLLGN